MGAQAGEGVGVGVGVDAILELDDDDRKETAYATRTVYLSWQHLPLIAIANNAGSLPLLICAILITLLAICTYRTMTVAIVADITPRPLRTKADSVQKIVGYAGTGVMLAAISVMVPNVERPDYLPLFLLQTAFVLECCSSNSVGRYSGYYYTVGMAAQVITPILSGVVMDVNPAMLFAYITGMGVLMGLSVAGAKHGDAILIDKVVRREEAAEAE